MCTLQKVEDPLGVAPNELEGFFFPCHRGVLESECLLCEPVSYIRLLRDVSRSSNGVNDALFDSLAVSVSTKTYGSWFGEDENSPTIDKESLDGDREEPPSSFWRLTTALWDLRCRNGG